MEPITKEVSLENGDTLYLTYEVIEGDSDYGIQLTAQRRMPIESVQIPNITSNPLEIERLLVVLSTCSVTPTSVSDILDDYRVERAF
ncbi:MAG: hypothetical protein E7471_00410 [Ruminococcaceae bacterium]|nr:hypothetical protein [Oscillospiraceae bacterium]